MSFQTTVALIAIILLILVLVFVGYSLVSDKKNKPFPPIIGGCPDYWSSASENGVDVCKNLKSLGNTECSKTMNFNVAPWIGTDGNCNKKKWASSCGITWDGITNDPNLCFVTK